MRILALTPYYKPAWYYGGPPKCIAEINEFLARQEGNQVDVLTLNVNGPDVLFPGRDPVVRQAGGVTVHYLPPSWFGRRYFASPLLRAHLEEFRDADIIHVNTLFNSFSRMGMQFARRRGIPYVVTVHGMLHRFALSRSKWVKRIHRALFEDKLLQAAAAIHFTAENELKHSVIRGRIHPVIIPLGFDFHGDSPPGRKPEKNRTRLLFLGRINRIKGIEPLLRGMAAIEPEKRKGMTLDLYGHDEEGLIPEYESLIHECGLEGAVRFRGTISPEARDEMMLQYDCLVLTSYQENFGLVVAEALAQALPVCVSDEVNLCDFVAASHCGWVTPLSVPAIATTLQAIHESDHDTRVQMGVKGFHAVREAFGIDRVARQYLALYKSILSKSVGAMPQARKTPNI